ncbi:DUF4280 domain-containing protein [Candidatus Finniella inopinata]|uniref:DUF4280 domain-containing protein n=1 Tax=Candidatus Finniella inopinata TaxID=1696036 RepID=A0A4Q7DL99_9PROT|nr:DUF4280 domain-containing protein [Candidatus Finniella inopinata]RZI46934.1 DUF4280 domain-containing protein [Candidatus Finniella inopinata]
MGVQTISTAPISCCMGTAPATLTALPISFDLTMVMPAATINDHLPFLNILPFGMCITLGNPLVAAATAAALGILVPLPCLPMTMAPWAPGAPTVQLGGQPALNDSSVLTCMWGAAIAIGSPGQPLTMIP